MSKKGLFYYLGSEIFLLFLIEIGKLIGWGAPALPVLMYTAILINTAIVAYRFYHLGISRMKYADKYVAFALFATGAADIFLTLIDTQAVYLPGVILF